MNIFAVIPVHNRREMTLGALQSLKAIIRPEGVSLRVCVIDDGSTDGTGAAIAARYPDVYVHRTDGTLFWSGAVRLGIDLFLESDATYLWLLNDDMVLDPECLVRLFKAVQSYDAWVISATIEDANREIIYGGIIQKRFFRFRRAVESDYISGFCYPETVNGNCLLVAREGLIQFQMPAHGVYSQEGLDMYIGLESTRLGRRPIVVREARCYCEPNMNKLWFYQDRASLGERVRAVIGPKGFPPRMYWDFCKRFAGVFGPLYFLRPYLRVIFPRRAHPMLSLH